MKKRFPFWTLGLLGIILVILVPVLYFLPRANRPSTNPADYLPQKPVHVDHADIVRGEFKTGPDVTRGGVRPSCLPPRRGEPLIATLDRDDVGC